jgi:nitrite reductase/ring-hydroxylating ferredoxin subunit
MRGGTLTETWHAIGPLGSVPEGVLHAVEVAGEGVLLVRHGETVHASSLHCPHKFGNLAEGHLDGVHVTCPMHTATFDLASGRPKPGQEWAGVLPIHATRVREGILEVLLP